MPPCRIAVAVWLFFVAGGNSIAAASATVATERGLHSVTYTTPQGKIRVNFPDDMAAGDTISGTVFSEPVGANDQERIANGAVLQGTVIDVDGQKSTAATHEFKIQVPALVRPYLPISFGSGGASSSPPAVTTNVPLAPTPAAAPRPMGSGATQAVPTPAQFNWPPALPQAAPATIKGAFDGDASNTRLQIGSSQASMLAESPRQTVFQLPPSSTAGPTNLTLTEGATSIRGPVRSVRLQLSAPKTTLQRGESTQLTVQVFGLEGLAHPIPLQLRTGGTVTATGGNLQRFDIPANDPGVVANGVYQTTRTLTGVSAGGFEVVAEVAWAQPAAHWLVGSIVHVEGEPGGQPGRWRVPVIFAGSKEKTGIYFDGPKPPNLHYCNWIEIKSAEKRDGIDYVTDYGRTTDPSKKPKPPPPTPPPPVPPPPPGPTGAGSETKAEPPPCGGDEVKVLSSEERKFTLLDGKQELFTQVYTDKDGAAVAAGDFADYLKKIAELGGKVSEHLPDGEGAGGAVVDFLLKYLEHGSAVIDEVLKGKLKLAGATKFTAVLDVGLRDVVATCATVEICVRGKKMTEHRFTQTETKRREKYVKTALKGDDEWEKITDSSGHIDPAKASKWAEDFFKETANVLKTGGDDLQKFKDGCK